MKLIPKFNIELTANQARPDIEKGAMYGSITIDDFCEIFYMSPSKWSKEDYQKQWNLAFEKLIKKENCCFIVNIQDLFIEMWALYVDGSNIYIQNYLITDEYYKKLVGDKLLTPETSFNFIPRRETITQDGYPISEWHLKII